MLPYDEITQSIVSTQLSELILERIEQAVKRSGLGLPPASELATSVPLPVPAIRVGCRCRRHAMHTIDAHEVAEWHCTAFS
jgi:hypothetical protein